MRRLDEPAAQRQPPHEASLPSSAEADAASAPRCCRRRRDVDEAAAPRDYEAAAAAEAAADKTPMPS